MKYLYFLICSLFFQLIGAQNPSNCTNALYEANRLYESGKFTDAIALLEPCALNSKLGKRKKPKLFGYLHCAI